MEKEKCPERLFKIYSKVYSSARLENLLRAIDIVAVLLVVSIFGVCAYMAFADSVYDGVLFLVLSAVPFAVVTVMRHVISSPRPYEVYDLEFLVGKRPHYKMGRSFPSRHVFSAFLIGVIAFRYLWPLGAAVLAIGVILAAIRTILGIHFLKDVVCGAIIGVLSGIISIIIL